MPEVTSSSRGSIPRLFACALEKPVFKTTVRTAGNSRAMCLLCLELSGFGSSSTGTTMPM
ncbi:MAG: hypothetical protein CR997_06495 [Acidobacteria bacterium]|nr:MAG: hypothetical protein CR997_06495 [Acidobacteriota bacterium]